MKNNMGMFDRKVRGVLAIVFLVLWFWWPSWLLFVLAFILAATAIIGVCPLYYPLGVDSMACCAKQDKKPAKAKKAGKAKK